VFFTSDWVYTDKTTRITRLNRGTDDVNLDDGDAQGLCWRAMMDQHGLCHENNGGIHSFGEAKTLRTTNHVLRHSPANERAACDLLEWHPRFP
jgi:hypothetical protein